MESIPGLADRADRCNLFEPVTYKKLLFPSMGRVGSGRKQASRVFAENDLQKSHKAAVLLPNPNLVLLCKDRCCRIRRKAAVLLATPTLVHPNIPLSVNCTICSGISTLERHLLD